MATYLLRDLGHGVLTNSYAIVHSCGDPQDVGGSVVRSMLFVNTDSSPVTVDVGVLLNGKILGFDSPFMLLQSENIEAGNMLVHKLSQSLSPGDRVIAKASTTNKVKYKMNGLIQTPN